MQCYHIFAYIHNFIYRYELATFITYHFICMCICILYNNNETIYTYTKTIECTDMSWLHTNLDQIVTFYDYFINT